MSIVSLKINVVSVSHLPKTDFGFWASCDGFVCLELGTAKAQTTHVKNTYDPKFHQHFSFTLENGDAGQMLKVIVMDADILTNEEIGRTEIEVSKTLAAGFVTLNIKDDTGNTVIGKSGQPTEVLLHLEVVEMEAVATAVQNDGHRQNLCWTAPDSTSFGGCGADTAFGGTQVRGQWPSFRTGQPGAISIAHWLWQTTRRTDCGSRGARRTDASEAEGALVAPPFRPARPLSDILC
eukprot:2425511-Rhodomonas_salina.1